MNMNGLSLDPLVNALLEGDQVKAVSTAKELREQGIAVDSIITNGLEVAMTRLDNKCTIEQFNLLEIMLVGRASMAVIKELYPSDAIPPLTKGVVVIGSLEGDIHDLGKNILKMVLTAQGYRVIDCGKDCPVDTLIDHAERGGALAIGVSGLITTIIPQIKQIKHMLVERGLHRIKILAGGAALKQAAASQLNVDYVAETAFDGSHYLEHMRSAHQCSGGEREL